MNHLYIFNIDDTKTTMKNARIKYNEIIELIPAYGKNDILFITLLSGASLAAIYLSLSNKPTVQLVEKYYRDSMNSNGIMRIFLKGTKNFSRKYQKELKKDAAKSQHSTNPYTWRFKFISGKTLDSFDALFDKCGICELYKKLGIFDIVPALCAYDYEMARYTKTIFTRKHTIASGDGICDCHYKKKEKDK